MKRKKRRPITLIEIMVVILLIGIIGGALAFNMRGSMEEGKVFKTEQNQNRIHDILQLEYAKGTASLQEIQSHWKEIVTRSPLAKGGGVLQDGWGQPFQVTVDEGEDTIEVVSPNLNRAKRGA